MTEKLSKEDFMEQMKALREPEETPEERKKRKKREYMKAYLAKKKAEKADAVEDPEEEEPVKEPEGCFVVSRSEAEAIAWVIDKAFILAVKTGTEMDTLRAMELMHLYGRACLAGNYVPGGE